MKEILKERQAKIKAKQINMNKLKENNEKTTIKKLQEEQKWNFEE